MFRSKAATTFTSATARIVIDFIVIIEISTTFIIRILEPIGLQMIIMEEREHYLSQVRIISSRV
jgi:hypothetical protein